MLLAYGKIWLYDELLASTLPDDPWVATRARPLLPARAAASATPAYMDRHPLKREIIATHVTNSMLNRVGSTFVHRLVETTGARPHEIVRAYLLAREIFGFVALWKAIEALDNRVDDALQATMLIDASRAARARHDVVPALAAAAEDMAATIAHFAPRRRGAGRAAAEAARRRRARAGRRGGRANTRPRACPRSSPRAS